LVPRLPGDYWHANNNIGCKLILANSIQEGKHIRGVGLRSKLAIERLSFSAIHKTHRQVARTIDAGMDPFFYEGAGRQCAHFFLEGGTGVLNLDSAGFYFG
jgi:hypothetical protein